MLDKATNEALEASFDDFAKTQRELNIELKRLKEAAKLVRQNKGGARSWAPELSHSLQAARTTARCRRPRKVAETTSSIRSMSTK